MRDLKKGREALRRGRVSVVGGEYFLTICTGGERAGLTSGDVAKAILDEARAMNSDGTWSLRCATVMLDHVHALVVLGERLPLGKAVARLKAKTAPTMRAVGLEWERDFFDRHARPDDDRIALFLYVFLNSFRAGLCDREERWPWYFCREEDWAWFRDCLADQRPQPEWLA